MKKYISNVVITDLRIEEGTNTNYFVKFKGENSLKDYSLFETEKKGDAIVVKHDIEYPITSDMYMLIKANIRDNYEVEIDSDNREIVSIGWIR